MANAPPSTNRSAAVTKPASSLLLSVRSLIDSSDVFLGGRDEWSKDPCLAVAIWKLRGLSGTDEVPRRRVGQVWQRKWWQRSTARMVARSKSLYSPGGSVGEVGTGTNTRETP